MKNFNNLNKNKSKAHGYRFTVGRVLQVVLALAFLIFVGRFLYIAISKDVAGQNIQNRTNELYKRNEVLKATRTDETTFPHITPPADRGAATDRGSRAGRLPV